MLRQFILHYCLFYQTPVPPPGGFICAPGMARSALIGTVP
ncbi:MAG: hypothetical protein ACJAWL_003760, partial [Motiliproteus sp.]